MIIVDKKSYALLEYLVQLEQPETVMHISKALNQSRRKIYYHLEKINDALPKDCEPIVSYPRVGIVLSHQQKELCQTLLDELNDYSYVMSVEERQQLLLAYIAIAQDKVTIEKMMVLSDVSRNTILNDLREIREVVQQEVQEMSLQVTKSKGYYLDCHPLVKVQWLYKLCKEIDSAGNPHFHSFMAKQLAQKVEIDQYFSPDTVAYLQQYLLVSQENLGKKINQHEYEFLSSNLPYLLLSYRNMELSPVEKKMVGAEFDPIVQRKEYRIVAQLAQELQERFDFLLDDIEVGLIAMLLLSFRKDQDSHVNSPDYADLRISLQVFIDQLVRDFGLHFASETDLRNQLLMHCKALLYRKTYGIAADNPLTASIQSQYPELFSAAKTCAAVLEEAWKVKLTDDEIAYLTIHIGGALRQSQTETKQRYAALICNEGIAIQKILWSQCLRYLPSVQLLGVFTSQQYEVAQLAQEVDFVVTTIQDMALEVPVIVVDPILSDSQIIRLLHIDRSGNLYDFQGFSEELKQILQPYLKDRATERKVRKTIEKTIYQYLLK